MQDPKFCPVDRAPSARLKLLHCHHLPTIANQQNDAVPIYIGQLGKFRNVLMAFRAHWPAGWECVTDVRQLLAIVRFLAQRYRLAANVPHDMNPRPIAVRFT